MTDRCCHLCRSHTGICLTSFQCDHHKEFEAQDAANHRATRDHADPVGDLAAANVDRERRNHVPVPRNQTPRNTRT